MAETKIEMKTKERPIMFTAESVMAILDGTKTQTRRIAPVLLPGIDKNYIWSFEDEADWAAKRAKQCRYGKPGDHLWVRETLKPKDECAANGAPRGIWAYYAADNTPCPGNETIFKTVPSIFMPRRMSRITLEITRVRVERLQEISDADTVAEGIASGHAGEYGRAAFRSAWDRINGKRASWASNPWVWVIEFRRVEE